MGPALNGIALELTGDLRPGICFYYGGFQMKFTLLPLTGYQSLRALNAYNALLLGLNMIPDYAHIAFEEFFHSIKQREPQEFETLIRKAASLVRLEEEEVQAMISFVADGNGVPYSKNSIKNLTPDDIFEIIVAVSIELSKVEINLVSEEEKKRLKISPLISGAFFQGIRE
jgi:hypothetical protein